MNGSTLMYCRSGGMPLVIGMRPRVEPDARRRGRTPTARAARRRRRGTRRAAGCSASPSRVRRVERLVDERVASRRRTARGRTARRARGCARGSNRRGQRARDAVGERRRATASSTRTPVSPGDDGFERAAAAERDDRAAAGLRLDRHDAEVFLAGQQHDARRAGTGRGSRRRPSAPEKLDVAGRPARSRRGALGAVADDLQRHAGAAGRPRSPRRSACRARGPTRRARKSLAAVDAVGVEEVGVDGRIHDSRLAIIVSADPARNIMRNSDIAVDAARRVAVPPRQPRHDAAASRALPAAPDPLRPEVGVELIPGVAHRRQAVAEVPAPRPGGRPTSRTQWLVLTTRSKPSRSNCSTAVGKSGR